MDEDQIPQAIPVTASEALDLTKIAAESTPAGPIPLADGIRRFGLVGCIVCSRGGHTGHTLYNVITSLATRAKGKACQDHVSQFLRPRDVE